MTITTLKTAVLDLLDAIGDRRFLPVIGGGYGIYLKYQQVLAENPRTLLQERPEPRSTNDIDMFLRTELLVDGNRLEPLKAALHTIGYQPVETAKFYQFAKPSPDGGEAGSLKIDLLAGPEDVLKQNGLKTDSRRVRPNCNIKGLHAHPVNEAPTLEANCYEFTIRGKLSSGNQSEAVVLLPHPFTFITMKLFALRDRIQDAEKDFGRHHALDIYTILSLMTEDEWNTCLNLRTAFADNNSIKEAGNIVRDLFADSDAMGMIRLREHIYCTPNLQLSEFQESLVELLG